MSRLHFYLANLVSTCLRSCICGWADYPGSRGSILSQPGTEKSDGDNAVLTQTAAFDQKATHTFPRKAVCLKPARRVYAVYCLPSGENSRWSGGCWVCLEWRNGQFDLLSGDGFQTWERKRKKKSCLTRIEPTFYVSLWQSSAFLSSHEDVPSLLCGKHKSSRLLENNNLVSEKPSYIKKTTVFTDAAMQWHDLYFRQPQKSSETFLLPLSTCQS